MRANNENPGGRGDSATTRPQTHEAISGDQARPLQPVPAKVFTDDGGMVVTRKNIEGREYLGVIFESGLDFILRVD